MTVAAALQRGRDFSRSGARACVLVLGCTIQVSTVLDNLLLVAFLALVLLSGDYAGRLRAIWSHPVARWAGVLGLLHGVSFAWAPAGTGAWRAVMDGACFLFLALWITFLTDERTRRLAVNIFLATVAVTLLLSWGLSLGLIPELGLLKGTQEHPIVFKSRITHTVIVAIAAGMLVMRAMDAQSRAMRIVYWTAFILAFLNVLLLVPGRTGQLALVTVTPYVLWARLGWRGLGLAGAIHAVVFLAILVEPTGVVRSRIVEGAHELRAWQPGVTDVTSVGQRLEFYRNSLELMTERPLLGAGAGSFAGAYAELVAGTDMVATVNPHNEFLRMGVQLGVVGLAILLWLLLAQWRQARHCGSPSDAICARAMIIVFVIASMVSSTFSDHTEGLLYAWLSAAMLGDLPRGASVWRRR